MSERFIISDGVVCINDEWDYRCNEYKTNNIDNATKFKTYKEAFKYLVDYMDTCKLKNFKIYRMILKLECCE